MIMTWLGILVCLMQSALFSGLTIGLFGLSRLRLEVIAEAGNKNAATILSIRKDANHLLSTLLWGNVSVNVLLTLLTDSVLSGIAAFVFSTFAITLFGEIIPQAYLARHAAQVGALLVPFVKFYQFLLYPIAKPTAHLLDLWLGREGIAYFGEDEFKIMLKKHAQSSLSEIGRLEATGAVNFLALDDVKISQEGERIDPKSILSLPIDEGRLLFPKFRPNAGDPFLQNIHASGKKWTILTNPENDPVLVLNTNRFLRAALWDSDNLKPYAHCHSPIVVTNPNAKLGDVIRQLKVSPKKPGDDVIDHDIILFWGKEKRIITGADLLGRLLRGIAQTPTDDLGRQAIPSDSQTDR